MVRRCGNAITFDDLADFTRAGDAFPSIDSYVVFTEDTTKSGSLKKSYGVPMANRLRFQNIPEGVGLELQFCTLTSLTALESPAPVVDRRRRLAATTFSTATRRSSGASATDRGAAPALTELSNVVFQPETRSSLHHNKPITNGGLYLGMGLLGASFTILIACLYFCTSAPTDASKRT